MFCPLWFHGLVVLHHATAQFGGATKQFSKQCLDTLENDNTSERGLARHLHHEASRRRAARLPGVWLGWEL